MKLLIIEDNKELVEVLSEGFSENGFTDDFTYDGQDGLKKARAGDHDCIILDLKLPKLSGLEILSALREEGKKVPVIMLTARDSIEDRVTGLAQGADDYLIKPFDFRELLARVNALIRRISEPKPALLRCGPLTLDPLARECRVGEETVPLRRREFDILELLMRHENQVFTRDKIISNVWQEEYEGTSNVVDVHVKYLRDKLRPFGLDLMVVTVRGVGYKVVCPDQA